MRDIKLTKIKQTFQNNKLKDVAGTLSEQLRAVSSTIPEGGRIAVGVGSRGIANLPVMVREVCDFLKARGAHPFVVPAMGSHGGAVDKGQAQVLEHLGVTEQTVGASVVSSMEVMELPNDGLKNRVYMDRHAWDSDGVVLINRVKPHTDFHASYESGLVKMSVIGLGKHKLAQEIHRFGVEGLTDLIPRTAQHILATRKILFGVAVVENARDETALIRVLKSSDFFKEEPALLALARSCMPSFPVDSIDVLAVDRMGKDISGTGLDPNIIGRIRIRGQAEPEKPDIKCIVVDDLTPASHGNALGVGLADVVTRRLFEKIDFPATYANVVTTTFLERGRIPVTAADYRRAMDIALIACGPIPSGAERIIRIRDTLSMEDMFVSRTILDEINDTVDVIEENIDFDHCCFE